MIDLTTDLDIFFADFGVAATITETAKADKAVTVLFDQAGFVENGVMTDKPQATLKETDLTGTDTKIARITISGTEYQMIKPLPDGAGLVVAGLKRD